MYTVFERGYIWVQLGYCTYSMETFVNSVDSVMKWASMTEILILFQANNKGTNQLLHPAFVSTFAIPSFVNRASYMIAHGRK